MLQCSLTPPPSSVSAPLAILGLDAGRKDFVRRMSALMEVLNPYKAFLSPYKALFSPYNKSEVLVLQSESLSSS